MGERKGGAEGIRGKARKRLDGLWPNHSVRRHPGDNLRQLGRHAHTGIDCKIVDVFGYGLRQAVAVQRRPIICTVEVAHHVSRRRVTPVNVNPSGPVRVLGASDSGVGLSAQVVLDVGQLIPAFFAPCAMQCAGLLTAAPMGGLALWREGPWARPRPCPGCPPHLAFPNAAAPGFRCPGLSRPPSGLQHSTIGEMGPPHSAADVGMWKRTGKEQGAEGGQGVQDRRFILFFTREFSIACSCRMYLAVACTVQGTGAICDKGKWHCPRHYQDRVQS